MCKADADARVNYRRETRMQSVCSPTLRYTRRIYESIGTRTNRGHGIKTATRR